jgi:hypothetical protein
MGPMITPILTPPEEARLKSRGDMMMMMMMIE